MHAYSIAYRALKTLSDDLSKVDAGKYVGLVLYCQTCLLEICAALEAGNSGTPWDDVQKRIIMALMDFTDRWTEWLTVSSARAFKSKHTRIFHESILRLGKGIIKAWRCWRIDLQK